MGSLIPVDDGPPAARCKLCGRTAVGPCARCRGAVCGDCCELTDGGATTFAICLTCVKRGGKSLAGGWLGLVAWLGAIIAGLAAIAAALLLAGCGGGRFETSGGTGSSSRLAIANGFAYWADPFVGIARAPLDQPGQFARLTRGGAGDGNVHVNATHVFWRRDAEVWQVPITGGPMAAIGPTEAGVAFNLAVDDAYLYYARGPLLVKQSLADGTATALHEHRATTSLALAGDALIGTSCTDGIDAVWRMPVDASAPPHRVVARGCPEVATVDDAFIYMFDLVAGRPSIVRVPLHGGEPVVLIESASSVFAVRDGYLYASDLDDRIVRVAVAGGQPTVILQGPVFGLAVDDSRLFYTHHDELAQVVLASVPLP